MKKVLPYQILVFTICEKHKKLIQNNKFKIPTPTWNDKFELSDGSHSISQIFKIILNIFKKKHNESIDNSSVTIHVN